MRKGGLKPHAPPPADRQSIKSSGLFSAPVTKRRRLKATARGSALLVRLTVHLSDPVTIIQTRPLDRPCRNYRMKY
jgi:hypothetical protein